MIFKVPSNVSHSVIKTVEYFSPNCYTVTVIALEQELYWLLMPQANSDFSPSCSFGREASKCHKSGPTFKSDYNVINNFDATIGRLYQIPIVLHKVTKTTGNKVVLRGVYIC